MLTLKTMLSSGNGRQLSHHFACRAGDSYRSSSIYSVAQSLGRDCSEPVKDTTNISRIMSDTGQTAHLYSRTNAAHDGCLRAKQAPNA